MHLDYQISADRRTLTIKADDETRAELRAMRAEMQDEQGVGEWGTDRNLCDVFEPLICNSELQWIAPEVCGDLTDAPILGIWGPERPGKGRDGDMGSGSILVTSGRDGFTVCDIDERWGFMSYALRSPLDDLIERGEAVFIAP